MATPVRPFTGPHGVLETDEVPMLSAAPSGDLPLRATV